MIKLEAFKPPPPYTSYGQWLYDTDPSYKAACDEAAAVGFYIPVSRWQKFKHWLKRQGR